MNRDQTNRTEMFNTVSAYMQANTASVIGMPAIGQTMNELNGKITAIAAKMSKQQTPITGAADQKAQVRSELEEKILEIADQLAAYAAAGGDMNLGSQVELTLSSLDKMPDDALEETAQRVSTLASANLTALGDYGVIASDVTALDGLKNQFHNVKTTPRMAVAGRAAETNTLPDLLTETTSLLRNRLDKQMTKFKKSNPTFYSGYRTARVIVDRGGAGGGATPPPAPPTP